MSVVLLAIAATVILFAVSYFLSKQSGVQSDSATDAPLFARLLISEVKLYNESKVAEALRNNNLSDVLRREIGQARKTYQNRFPNPEFASHFENALIEILADGDPNRLNSGFESSLR